MRSLGMVNPVRGEGLGLKTALDLGALGPEIVDAPGQGMAEKDQDIESQIFTTLFSNLLVIILLVNHDFSSGYHVLVGGGPTPFLYMATRFLPNVHVQKCTKMYIYVFSCLEVPWIDLLAVANLQ